MKADRVELQGKPLVRGQDYPRQLPDGRIIAVNPVLIPSMGRRGFLFNPDGTSRSASEIDCGVSIKGPDDGDILG